MGNMREPVWSVAKCHAVLYTAATCVDGSVPPSESTELLSLLTRAPTLFELSVDVLTGFVEEVQVAATVNDLDQLIDHALRTLPYSEIQSLSIYANCCELIYADHELHPKEEAFLKKIARKLRLPKSSQKLIERVLQEKARH